MNRIVFATHNIHKLKEVKELLKDHYEVVGLSDIGCYEDIPETANTFIGNAKIKSTYVYNKYGIDCFSDDSGLEVESLNGAPGILSARYAGKDHDDAANNQKLMEALRGINNRRAQFKTVISLILNGEEFAFEGVVKGDILENPQGLQGFGYDPLFQPKGYKKSFAELGDSIKNEISHRATAVKKLVTFLKNR